MSALKQRLLGYFLSRTSSILDDKDGNFERTESIELKKGKAKLLDTAGLAKSPQCPGRRTPK